MSNFTKILIVVAVIAYIISKRNHFEELRQKIVHANSNISVCVEKRRDCLEDAINIVRIGHSHEIQGIEKLTAKDQLNQLAFLGQKYPELQTINNYDHIVAQATRLNEEIAASREILNGNISEYNQSIASFPGLLIAKVFKYQPEKFIDEENLEANKKLKKRDLDFSAFMIQ